MKDRETREVDDEADQAKKGVVAQLKADDRLAVKRRQHGANQVVVGEW